MQLVQSSNGNIAGRFEQVTLQPDGKLVDLVAAVTGSGDGGTVALSLKPDVFLAPSISVSGTFDGQILSVSAGVGPGSFRADMTKADQSAFETQVASLASQAGQIRQSQADAAADVASATLLKGLRALTTKIDGFGPYADANFSKFTRVQQKYQTITADMQKALNKQKATIGGFDAGVARFDIASWIDQAESASSGLHDGVQAAEGDFESSTRSILWELPKYRQSCAGLTTGQATREQNAHADAWNAACEALSKSVTTFQDRVASLKQSFQHIEGVWADENAKQIAIVNASSSAQ